MFTQSERIQDPKFHSGRMSRFMPTDADYGESNERKETGASECDTGNDHLITGRQWLRILKTPQPSVSRRGKWAGFLGGRDNITLHCQSPSHKPTADICELVYAEEGSKHCVQLPCDDA